MDAFFGWSVWLLGTLHHLHFEISLVPVWPVQVMGCHEKQQEGPHGKSQSKKHGDVMLLRLDFSCIHRFPCFVSLPGHQVDLGFVKRSFLSHMTWLVISGSNPMQVAWRVLLILNKFWRGM